MLVIYVAFNQKLISTFMPESSENIQSTEVLFWTECVSLPGLCQSYTCIGIYIYIYNESLKGRRQRKNIKKEGKSHDLLAESV
jgi:hypothetical protein